MNDRFTKEDMAKIFVAGILIGIQKTAGRGCSPQTSTAYSPRPFFDPYAPKSYQTQAQWEMYPSPINQQINQQKVTW